MFIPHSARADALHNDSPAIPHFPLTRVARTSAYNPYHQYTQDYVYRRGVASLGGLRPGRSAEHLDIQRYPRTSFLSHQIRDIYDGILLST